MFGCAVRSRSVLGAILLVLAAAACGKESDSPGNASETPGGGGASGSAGRGGGIGGIDAQSGAAGTGGSSGDGSGGALAGAGGKAGSTSSGVPDGFTLAPGLTLLDVPECDDFSSTSCNGHCVTTAEPSNGCQAVLLVLAVSEFARDDAGLYFSRQASSYSLLYELAADTGAPLELARPPGDNVSVGLSLADDLLYFDVRSTLFSIPRAGGDISEPLAQLPVTGQFVVVGDRVFSDDPFDPEVHEIDLNDGSTVVHPRNVTSMLRDGTDLYFVEADTLYLASGAKFDATRELAPGPVGTLLGIEGDHVYALGGTDSERAVRRFPKTGGTSELIRTLGSKGTAALGPDAVVFTHTERDREFVCTVDLAGKHPTIHGYLPAAPSLLAASANHLYAAIGFNLVRLARPD